MAPKAAQEEVALDTVRRVVAFLKHDADTHVEGIESEALRFAAGIIEAELNIDDGDLAFLPLV